MKGLNSHQRLFLALRGLSGHERLEYKSNVLALVDMHEQSIASTIAI